MIAGNHDLTFDLENYTSKLAPKFHRNNTFDCQKVKESFVSEKGYTYLEHSGIEIEGIKFWGSPCQPEFCQMAFGLDRGEASRQHWDKIPPGTDVVITHGPPLGHGDQVVDRDSKQLIRAGCFHLLKAVQAKRPKVHIFGHIHEGHGITTDGNTFFVNAATCDLQYKPSYAPIVIDLPLPEVDLDDIELKLESSCWLGGDKPSKLDY